MHSPSSDDMKRAAAARALEAVRPGMRLGLGTGSTAAHFVSLLGEKTQAGLDVLCVPTSERTRLQAASLRIPLSTLDETPQLDLTVDGADEADAAFNLIKGGGGALLREKIVAAASRRMIVILDKTKLVTTLGAFPLPVEIDRFGARATHLHVARAAQELGLDGAITLRAAPGGHDFITDGGHVILDCRFGRIPDAAGLAVRLQAIPGVVEHGLFIGLASALVIADGASVQVLGHLD